jgi:RNA-directed DNA polymerase
MAAGRRWVVDIDLEKFFERVSHDVLMARVARQVADKRVNGRGPWWNAGASHMNDAFRQTFFDQLGLLSLLEQHRRLHYAP